MFDPSNALKYSIDSALAIPSILGICRYESYLITIANDRVKYNDPITNKMVVETRLLVSDGYRCYAPGYYLNPMLKQNNGENVVLSNGQLTSNQLLLGPLVFPYCFNGCNYGIDPLSFQPAGQATNNVQIYIQIRGVGLSPKGNIFQVKEVKIDGMTTLSYYLELEATLTAPNLT
jgi:hypothetical protein